MKSLLLISIVLAWIVIPVRAARHPSARRGLARMVIWLLVVTAAYVGYITQLHPFLHVPHWP